MDTNTPWYVVHTMVRREKNISDLLNKRGILNYLPMTLIIRQWSDRKKRIKIPLFPGYIFVRVSDSDRYGILDIPGVLKYVSDGGPPTRLNKREIELIQHIINEPLDDELPNNFDKGDWVQITSGPLEGLHGQLTSLKGKNKLVVEIASIKKHVIIEFSSFSVRKLEISRSIVS